MKQILTAVLLTVSILSCSQQTTETHKVKHKANHGSQKMKVVNRVDPICKMDIDASVKDTAVYKGKVYGFCSPSCKKEFKKSPQKFIK